ncbi:glycosyltransferase family 4 protein [Mariniblastus fucicola]|uniref:D-inositol-3-phosphate glycosyltransferase n=1 Tax=Mariniblastus fucicola TaxID=980251 RepID=A0A5B9PLS0_9BACT|nr:glycosyltransferase family 4 protein [Mariniblastus fucicola]QEG23243.1 D-inositol-3-phosphate glycosyltransferase [Mariniblastus fucicola]
MRNFPNLPSIEDAHVVVLTNYLRRHHALVYREVAKHVGKLTLLLSTDMEPDRSWSAEWGDLDVTIQKNWMHTAKARHSTGFEEPNFIHVPIDTVGQLRRLNPDIVFSYEMGMRTALCGLFRMLRRRVPLVMVGNMAEHIEQERGPARRMLRRFVRGRVDFATYNGPSCHRYLNQIGFDENQLFHFPYCIDEEKTFDGVQRFSNDDHRNMIYCGSINERKNILPFARSLANRLNVCDDAKTVTLSIAGEGDLAEDVLALQSDRLQIRMLGNCGPGQLSEAYRDSDICVFPTLGDEWGLVPTEAMRSGLPVLGSVLAQSVEATVTDNENGWVFDPREPLSVEDAIDRALETPTSELAQMSVAARDAVSHVSPQFSAHQFCNAVRAISGRAPVDMPEENPVSRTVAVPETV